MVKGVVEIYCRELLGVLTFIKSIYITISGLVFNGCSVEHSSTTYDFSHHDTDAIRFLTFNTTFYFDGWSSIILDSVTIKIA